MERATTQSQFDAERQALPGEVQDYIQTRRKAEASLAQFYAEQVGDWPY